MPYKDKEKQREYQRDWVRRKFADDNAAQERREQRREWRNQNREHINEYGRAFRKTKLGKVNQRKGYRKRRIGLKQWYRAYKRTLCCSQCGENHPATLDFHHTDPVAKKFNVSHLFKMDINIEQLKAEIDKCEVLCANCHRKLHWVDSDEYAGLPL